MKQQLLKTFLACTVGLSLFTSTSFAATNFGDVTSKHWAYKAVNWGSTNGIVQGYNDGTFKPSKNVTGAEFLTMFVKAYKPTNLPNVDSGSPWDEQIWQYAKNMNWDISDRSTAISRGGVANIVANAMGYSCSAPANIQLLLDTGISEGKTSKTIEGYAKDNKLNRAEAIQFVMNAQQKIYSLSKKPGNASTDCPKIPMSAPTTKVTQGNYTLNTSTTDNSRISFTATLPTDNAVLFLIKKGDYEIREVYKTASKKLNASIYLKAGSGDYTVEVYEKVSENGSSKAYKSVLWGDTAFTVKNTDQRDLEYLLPSVYVQSDDPEVIALAKQITQGKTTNMEKTKAIHDWVAKNIAYDTVAYFNDDAQWMTTKEILAIKSGVCSHYANVAVALNRAVGIKARTIVGTTIWSNSGETWANTSNNNNHAWIETFVDGRWVVQDPTWNAGYIDMEKKKFVKDFSTDYFDPKPEKFALDHKRSHVSND